jgi:eukaryotic-like serine/threonine-protein kinase
VNLDPASQEEDAAAAHAAGFTLIRPLGAGSAGRVWQALDLRDPARERVVALKRLASSEADLCARFRREGRLALRLRHRHLVAALDVIDRPDALLIVLEYVPGPSLATRLQQGPLAPDDVLRLLAEVGDALAYAHGQQVMHRDVKPSNVLQAPDGLKLCDLGLARGVASTTSLTTAGTWVGTPSYMAPEHLAEAGVGPAADVYSLGATAYHAITGQVPFPSRSLIELAHRLLHEVPPPVRRLRPDAPKDLVTLIEACMEKEPDARPTAAEVSTAARVLRGH